MQKVSMKRDYASRACACAVLISFIALMAAGFLWSFAAQADEEHVVENTTTGVVYDDFSEAWEAAEAGDTIALLDDVDLNDPLTRDKDLALDLNGHELALDATLEKGAASDAGADGISLSGGAALTVADSSSEKSGSLAIEVGSKNETSAKTYQGIDLTDGSTLNIDGAALSVTYAGESLALPKVELHGVSLETGSLNMAGAAKLTVQAAKRDRSYGAGEVSGIWASADSTGGISVGDEASVKVANNARPLLSDSPDYPDYTGTTSAQSSSSATLIEVQVAEGSELDKQIQEAFQKSAAFDSADDAAGKVYSANIYYGTALELENGMTVWAYSDQIADADAGKLSSIVAKHVFVRGGSADPLNAYGVYAQAGYAGSVTCTGSVDVSTSAGNAVGFYGEGTASSWQVDQDKVAVSCDSAPYVVKTSKRTKFDLRDYISISGFDSQRISYPKNNYLYEGKTAQPQAVKVASSALEEASGTITDSNIHDALYSAMDQEVQVTFTGLHDASGNKLDDVNQTLAYGKTLKESGADQITSEDYTNTDGTSCRFVGWKLSGVSSVYAYDAEAVYASTPMTSSVNGAAEGQVTYTAQYCEVPSGEHLITFRLEDELFAYAVEDGATPSYLEAHGMATTGLDTGEPEKIRTEDGYTYDFAGWVSGLDDESIVQDGDTVLEELPAATEDAGYTARFTKEVQGVLVTIKYKKMLDGALTDLRKTLSSVDWQKSAFTTLNEYATVGETMSWQGVNYTFEGWSPRESDTEPLYSQDFYLSPQSDSFIGSGVKLFGVYTSADQYVDVAFHSGDEVIGETSVAASTTVQQALDAAGIVSSKINPPSAGQELRGWNTSADATTVLVISTLTVGAAGEYADTLDVYAVWGTKRYTVTFYDSDKETRLGAFYVESGSTVEDSNSDFEITLTGVKKDTFDGWVTENGDAFSTSETAVTEDMKVYAHYKTYSTGTGKASKSAGSGGIKVSGGGSSAATVAKSGAVTAAKAAKAAKAAEAKAAASSNKANAAAATQASATTGSATGNASNVGTGNEGTLASRIAIAVVLAVFLALVASVLLWLKRRNGKDDDAEVADIGPVGMERIHF